jgi:hypothetical protein
MEAGIKLWAIFWLKDGASDRIQLRNLWMKLADYPNHKAWIEQNCGGEVITLQEGDLL